MAQIERSSYMGHIEQMLKTHPGHTTGFDSKALMEWHPGVPGLRADLRRMRRCLPGRGEGGGTSALHPAEPGLR